MIIQKRRKLVLQASLLKCCHHAQIEEHPKEPGTDQSFLHTGGSGFNWKESENLPWLKNGMLLVEVLDDKQVENLLKIQLLSVQVEYHVS